MPQIFHTLKENFFTKDQWGKAQGVENHLKTSAEDGPDPVPGSREARESGSGMVAGSHAKARLPSPKVTSKCLEELADHQVDTSQMLWGSPGASWAGFKLKSQSLHLSRITCWEGRLVFSISNKCLLSKGQIEKAHVRVGGRVRKVLVYWWLLSSPRLQFLSKPMQRESIQQGAAILFYRGLTTFIAPDFSLSFPSFSPSFLSLSLSPSL